MSEIYQIGQVNFTIQEEKIKYKITDEEKERLKSVALEKAKIRKANIEKFVEEYHKYPKGYNIFRILNMDGKFVILEEKRLKAITKMSGVMGLYLYLTLSINREVGYSKEGDEEEVFAKLDKYYLEGGFLCTIRTQGYIAKKLGTSQQNISNWFKKLERLGVIKKIGEEKIVSYNEEYIAPVYSLGEIINIEGMTDEEVFYYETLL